mmetsp:Transcript_99970/g.260646  ORF Transcript_99970/g.260646 Transcript_99970/m.260646 type:complete len:201 (-) Transcript_99970:2-604(-)
MSVYTCITFGDSPPSASPAWLPAAPWPARSSCSLILLRMTSASVWPCCWAPPFGRNIASALSSSSVAPCAMTKPSSSTSTSQTSSSDAASPTEPPSPTEDSPPMPSRPSGPRSSPSSAFWACATSSSFRDTRAGITPSSSAVEPRRAFARGVDRTPLPSSSAIWAARGSCRRDLAALAFFAFGITRRAPSLPSTGSAVAS